MILIMMLFSINGDENRNVKIEFKIDKFSGDNIK